MRVALLSAGPSLRRTFDPGAEFDLRVGVNTAVEAFACDWWAAGDAASPAIQRIQPLGNPALFALGADVDRLAARMPHRLTGRDVLRWSDLRGLGAPQGWDTYSATAALVLAAHLGAARVEVFGADMAGLRDYAGGLGGNRSERRWEKERGIWHRVVRWLEERGIEVVRWLDAGNQNADPATAASPAGAGAGAT